MCPMSLPKCLGGLVKTEKSFQNKACLSFLYNVGASNIFHHQIPFLEYIPITTVITSNTKITVCIEMI